MTKKKGDRNSAEPEIVAGNGLLNRRALLGRGMMFAGAAGTGVGLNLNAAAAEPLQNDPWSLGQGQTIPPYAVPSHFESGVVKTMNNPNAEPRNQTGRAPHHKMEGIITPNGLFFAETRTGAPDIDPALHRLAIHGLVKQPMLYSLADLDRYPKVTRVHFVECGGNSAPMFRKDPVQATAQDIHGLVSCAEWTGVLLSTLLEETGIDPKAKWFLAEGGDAPSLNRSIPLAKAMDDAMIAIYQNGERLMPGNGYPMRLLVPGYVGNMNVKWLRRIKLIESPIQALNETIEYVILRPDGKSWQFFFTMEVKSFITNPSPGHILKAPGFYEISGIAYSGNGRIAKVMVSADGGKSYAEAALQDPVHSKSFTRFRMPWRWDGGPAILQSRAWDEAGNLQPTHEQFNALRGTPSQNPPVTAYPMQHANVITSWGVKPSGELAHVYT